MVGLGVVPAVEVSTASSHYIKLRLKEMFENWQLIYDKEMKLHKKINMVKGEDCKFVTYRVN